MAEKVLVIGAGIAGLNAALALGPSNREIVLLERDGPPPEGSADDAFRDWQRRGVGHLRQSHAFLARLGLYIKNEHPQLLKDLKDLGVRELGFEGMLSPEQKAKYVPKPEDADFSILTSRRTTLELVIRRYVERLPNVAIKSNMVVRKLLTDKDANGVIRVLGVAGDDENGAVEMRADVVVDASGKNGSSLDQLVEMGAPIAQESETAGILYFTRHYRFKDGEVEPKREEHPPSGGDLGYLKFGVFPADNGCFSITACTPEIEYEMRKAIMHPEMWDKMIEQLPGLKVWTSRAEPVSKVFGMGDLHSRWRDLVTKDGKPAVIGFFSMGDTLVRTNPLYGRGCSFAAVEAHLVRDVLNQTSDPTQRTIAYHKLMQKELRPFFTSMRSQDRGAIKRAEQALIPEKKKKSLGAAIGQSFAMDGVMPAMRLDIDLMRESMRGFHMLEHPNKWLTRPKNIIKIVGFWMKPKSQKKLPPIPKAGPERDEMMKQLGLSAEADILILAERKKTETKEKVAA